MPLTNSMKCAGNLIGFNSGGYKALSRSLNIQVPFIETTLLTPRRCFERVAEKCYDNSLSSIVASCSWDKHMDVGTGSQLTPCGIRKKLDLTKWMEWMSTTFCTRSVVLVETNSNPACLGEEIDDLMEMDGIKSNPAWQEIEVDNLMGLDEAADWMNKK